MESNSFILNGKKFSEGDHVKITTRYGDSKNIIIDNYSTVELNINIKVFLVEFFVYESTNDCLYFKDNNIKKMVVVHIDDLLSCDIYREV